MLRKLLLKFGDYVFVTRPLILVPAWSFYLLGAAAGRRVAGAGGRSHLPTLGAPEAFVYGLACLSAVLIAAYLVNQVFDRESDALNDKGHFLTRGVFSVRTVVLMALVSFLLASYLFRLVAPAQRAPLVLALVLSLAYSLPPLRLVARPFVDLLANAAGYGGIAYVLGFASWNASTGEASLLAVPYVLLVGATFLHTTIMDESGDREAGKFTTSVLIGAGPSAALACALSAAALVPALAVSMARYGDRVAPAVAAVCATVFAYAALRRSRGGGHEVSSNAVQAATAAVTLPAVVAWPEYLLVIVPVVVSARYYYRARFGVIYPGPAAGPPGGDA